MNKIDVDISLIKKGLVKRKSRSNKYDYGNVTILAGSRKYGGASLMASSASIYSGSGLTTLISDLSNRIPLLSRTPETMFIDQVENRDVLLQLSKTNIALLGSGWDIEEAIFEELLAKVINSKTNFPIVLDAGALALFDKGNNNHLVVATPHLGEWHRMSGLSYTEIENDLNNISAAFELGIEILVLKDSTTRIYDISNQTIYYANFGGSFMSTGGSGDVLAGIITSFVGQGLQNNVEIINSVISGVGVHGITARQVAESQFISLPTQLVERLPKTIWDLLQ
ncbi:MAG: NAD(P)H-hydrate dehydratase [Lactobacillaceae bacterium]|jgi:hydroxyethylthiazole kinase-like uncharacterized protein yjeF|nr:NAD(P)H-hydrate dehydratase [Lactobacillaceae bacterium]